MKVDVVDSCKEHGHTCPVQGEPITAVIAVDNIKGGWYVAVGVIPVVSHTR